MQSKVITAKVGVVLVNWNGGEFTVPCIESLFKSSVLPDRIVVVDNGSNDGSPELIAKYFPKVILVRNPHNVGFAEANNQGVAFLVDTGVRYVWLLNNDTVVHRECLARLLECAEIEPYASCFTGKIYFHESSKRVWYAGAFRHRWHLAPKHIQNEETLSGEESGCYAVEFVTGCCMLIPMEALLRYGGFYSEYCAYSEDNEWCWRVHRAGGRLIYVPSAILWHKVSATVRKNTGDARDSGISARAYFLMVRNNLWTIRLHAQPVLKKLLALLLSGGVAVKMMALCLSSGRVDKTKAVLKGGWEGLAYALPNELYFPAPKADSRGETAQSEFVT